MEIDGVLKKKFRWPAIRIKEALRKINGFTTSVELGERVQVVEQDDADNRILECAIAANASVIVSGDHHLREIGSFRDIRIVTVRTFLQAMR